MELNGYEHKVQYYETDQMGCVHHSNYIRWFEEARTAYLEQLDMVLIMTVEPGFGGQSYLDFTTDKIRAVCDEIKRRGLSTEVQVDGGINRDTIRTVLDAGANVIVAGSSVFGGDIGGNIRELRTIMQEYEK